jgi:hypothetical protein
MNNPHTALPAFALAMLIAFPILIKAESIEAGLELHLGQTPASMLLVPIETLATAVTVQLIPFIDCPASMKMEFDLRKVNAPAAFPVTVETNSMVCAIDSIHIDTTSVYEVPVPGGASYYMRPLRRDGTLLRVRLTSELPSGLVVTDPPQGHSRVGVAGSLAFDSLKVPRDSEYLTPTRAPIVIIENRTPTICPITRTWELAYRRVNPAPGRIPLSVKVDRNCKASDSVALDTGIVYEYYSAYDFSGGTNLRYYLKALPGEGRLIRFQLFTENPLAIGRMGGKAVPAPSGLDRTAPDFQADGRKIRKSGNRTLRIGSSLPAPITAL